MEYIDNVSVLITFWDIVLQKGVVGVFFGYYKMFKCESNFI